MKKSNKKNSKLWGGRFKKPTDPAFDVFSASYRWDCRLFSYDIEIDRAHVKALRRCGVLSVSEEKKLQSALASLKKSYDLGVLKLSESSEDVHSAIQTELKSIAGSVADKIHTGRSRNDLVSQSSRLYLKDHLGRIEKLISQLQRAWVSQAEQNQKCFVAAMTHMQPAQIMSQAHIFLSYVEMLERSKAQVRTALGFCDVCVLGSGALAGSTYDLSQTQMAKALGLSAVTNNSYDVSGDRDFVLTGLFALEMIGVHLSRIAEDLMIAQTRGYMTVDIDQPFCTGSSMMPQKKNADFVELARGAAGIFIGNLAGFASTLKGLPTSYNRDLQWDKKFIFESVETCEDILDIFTRLASSLKVNSDRTELFLKDESLYATDLADYLVNRGVPFKQAHEQVGQIVSFAEDQNIAISKIGIDLLKKFTPSVEADIYDIFSPAHSVAFKKTQGSTSPGEVKKQIQRWKTKLK